MKSNPYIGIYEIDMPNSKLGKYAKNDSISDLKLIIKEDSTFQFSKEVPFIFQQTGKWELRHFEPLDGPPKDECYLTHGSNNRDDVLLPMSEKNNKYTKVYFEYPIPQKGQGYVDFLCFKRIE